jgi:hypothetical protein
LATVRLNTRISFTEQESASRNHEEEVTAT